MNLKDDWLATGENVHNTISTAGSQWKQRSFSGAVSVLPNVRARLRYAKLRQSMPFSSLHDRMPCSALPTTSAKTNGKAVATYADAISLRSSLQTCATYDSAHVQKHPLVISYPVAVGTGPQNCKNEYGEGHEQR